MVLEVLEPIYTHALASELELHLRQQRPLERNRRRAVGVGAGVAFASYDEAEPAAPERPLQLRVGHRAVEQPWTQYMYRLP